MQSTVNLLISFPPRISSPVFNQNASSKRKIGFNGCDSVGRAWLGAPGRSTARCSRHGSTPRHPPPHHGLDQLVAGSLWFSSGGALAWDGLASSRVAVLATAALAVRMLDFRLGLGCVPGRRGWAGRRHQLPPSRVSSGKVCVCVCGQARAGRGEISDVTLPPAAMCAGGRTAWCTGSCTARGAQQLHGRHGAPAACPVPSRSSPHCRRRCWL